MSTRNQVDVGELYRRAFNDFSPTPRQGGFDAVQKALRTEKLRVRRLRMAAGAGALAVTLALLWVFMHDQPARVEQAEPVAVLQENQTLTPENTGQAAEITPAVPREQQTEQASGETVTGPAETGQAVQQMEESPAITAGQPAEHQSPATVQPQSPGTAGIEPPAPRTNTFIPPVEENTYRAGTDIHVTEDTSICLGESIILMAEGGVKYRWGDGSLAPEITVSPHTTTTYRVTVTDALLSDKQYDITVTVRDCAELIFPNAFTPNYDSKNDVFLPVGQPVQDYLMRIFTRNGEMIFESQDFFLGWNGEINGQPAPAGVYVYMITYVNRVGERKVVPGSLTLLR